MESISDGSHSDVAPRRRAASKRLRPVGSLSSSLRLRPSSLRCLASVLEATEPSGTALLVSRMYLNLLDASLWPGLAQFYLHFQNALGYSA